MKRILVYMLCLLMFCAMLPVAVMALEEPETAQREEVSVEEEAPAEEPVSGEDLPTTYTLPSGETIEVNPEDPMYERMMSQTVALDGAWSDMVSFKDFKPRSVTGETVLPGIDVSEWQGTINWQKVADSGVEFVFLRAALRFTGSGKLATDLRFHENYRGAKAAGLEVGVYIYSQAITEAEGIEEARYLMNLVEGYDIDLPLVIDYEYMGTSGRLYNANLSRREGTDVCLAFCEEVEKNGYDGMVYANLSMLNNDLYRDEFSRVWLAHYTKQTSYTGDYEYWQCSQSGSVAGIGGAVDLNFGFRPEPVTPTPVPTPEETDPFTDVTKGAWYYDTVVAAYEQGIVNGTSATTFSPDETASRGQVVTMLWRLMGKPAPGKTSAFEDLTEEYYRDAVNWAAEKGVVNGYSETVFCPNEQICRQDLVTILYRMAGFPDVSGGLENYSDGEEVQDYAKNAVIWAVSKGVITGYDDATLRPNNFASRAEVCTILMRFIDL